MVLAIIVMPEQVFAQGRPPPLESAARSVAERIAHAIPSSPRHTVAVVAIEAGSDRMAEYLIELISALLLDAADHRFNMVPRNDAELRRIAMELDFQRSGSVNPETIQSAGLRLGASLVVTGQFARHDDNYLFTLAVMHVEDVRDISRPREIVRNDDRIISMLGSNGRPRQNRGLRNLQPPSGTGNLSIVPEGSSEMRLSWNLVSGAGWYRLEFSESESGPWHMVPGADNVVGQTFVHSGLSPGITLYYRIIAANHGGRGPPSSAVSGTLAPSTPTGVSARPESHNTISVWWNLVPGAAGYRVEFAEPNSEEWRVVPGAANLEVRTVLHKGLPVNVERRYRVIAINRGGQSLPSSVVSAMTLLPPPSGVRVEISGNRVRVAWDEVPNALGYRVEFNEPGLDNWRVIPGANNVTDTFAYSPVPSAGMSHRYRVRTLNLDGIVGLPSSEDVLITIPPGTPTGIIAVAEEPGSIRVSWEDVVGATGFRLEFSENATGPWQVVPGAFYVLERTAVHTGLNANTRHWYRVFAVNNGGLGPVSQTLAALTLPSAPSGVTAMAEGTDMILVSWSAVPGAIGYHVEFAVSSEGVWVPIPGHADGASTNAVHSGLSPGLTKFYRVIAINAAGPGPTSLVVSGTLPPGAPTGVSVVTESDGVQVSWDTVFGATGYRVEFARSNEGPWNVVPGAVDIAETSFNITVSSAVPSAGASLFYRVIAVNAGGMSSASSNAILTLAPGIPTGVSAFAESDGIRLSWSEVSGATEYWVEFAETSDGPWNRLPGHTRGVNTNAVHSGLSPGLTRFYRVFAVNAAGEGPASEVVWGTLPPGVPTGVSTAFESDRIRVSWNAVHGATGYRVEFARSNEGPWNVVPGASDVMETIFNITDTSAIPATGTSFFYRVVAVNAGGTGPESSDVRVTMLPGSPTGVTTVVAGADSIRVSWNNVTGAAVYRVEFAKTNEGPWQTVPGHGRGADTSAVHSRLTPGDTLFYRIIAVNAYGGEGPPSTVSIITLRPATPEGVQAVAQSSSSIQVSWNAVTGATGFRVQFNAGGLWSDVPGADSLPASARYSIHSGIPANTQRQYRVFAMNIAGDSPASLVVTARTSPASPGGLSTAPDGTNIRISWNTVSGASSYRVEFSTTSGDGPWNIVPGAANTAERSVVHSGLPAGVRHWYRVSAINSAGAIGYPSASVHRMLAPRGTPVVTRAQWDGRGSGGRVRIEWSASGVSGHTHFRVEHRRHGTFGTWVLAADNLSGTSFTHNVSSRSTARNREYRVIAVNSVGLGPASAGRRVR